MVDIVHGVVHASSKRSISCKLMMSSWREVRGLFEHTVHNAVGAYSRPMPMRLGLPCELCGTLCSSTLCSAHEHVFETPNLPP